MTQEIRNRQLRAELANAGLESVHLYKGDGFFWITSDDDTCDGLRSAAIYVNSFRQLTPKQWLDEIRLLLSDENRN